MDKDTSVALGRVLALLIFVGAGIAGYLTGGVSRAVQFGVVGGIVGWIGGFAFPGLMVRLFALLVVIGAVGAVIALVSGQFAGGG